MVVIVQPSFWGMYQGPNARLLLPAPNDSLVLNFGAAVATYRTGQWTQGNLLNDRFSPTYSWPLHDSCTWYSLSAHVATKCITVA
jgi:hypothetical protein